MEQALNIFDEDLDNCLRGMNKRWMEKPRSAISKLPKTLMRSDF